MIHLDTHVVLWLHDRTLGKIGKTMLREIERGPVAISPFVLLEIEMLFAKDRSRADSDTVFRTMRRDFALELSQRTAAEIVERAVRFAWTRDAYDWLIVANAMADGAKLVTADAKILANFPEAVW